MTDDHRAHNERFDAARLAERMPGYEVTHPRPGLPYTVVRRAGLPVCLVVTNDEQAIYNRFEQRWEGLFSDFDLQVMASEAVARFARACPAQGKPVVAFWLSGGLKSEESTPGVYARASYTEMAAVVSSQMEAVHARH